LLGPPCDPHTGWRIIDGRLFCALMSNIMDKFVSLGDAGIKEGDARWTAWFGGLDKGGINTGCFPGDTMMKCMSGRPFPNRTAAVVV